MSMVKPGLAKTCEGRKWEGERGPQDSRSDQKGSWSRQGLGASCKLIVIIILYTARVVNEALPAKHWRNWGDSNAGLEGWRKFSPHYCVYFNRNTVLNATGLSKPTPYLALALLLLWSSAFWCGLVKIWRKDQGLCAEVSILVQGLKAALLAEWMFSSFPVLMSPPSFYVSRQRGCFRNM